MSIDVVGTINNGSTVLIVGILVLGIYRALGIRRGFVGGTYRSRATWSALLMLVIIISMLSNYVPVSDPNIQFIVGFVPLVALIFVILAYGDRSVLVAIETDFFHRDTLSWSRMRWVLAIYLVASIIGTVAGGFILTPEEQSSFLGTLLSDFFFFGLAGALAILTAALIVGARRSADRTLRRSILLLGLALSTLVLSIVATSFLTLDTLSYVIVYQGTGLVGIYLIYRSVMSLSPLGRVEKGEVGGSEPSTLRTATHRMVTTTSPQAPALLGPPTAIHSTNAAATRLVVRVRRDSARLRPRPSPHKSM